MRHSAVPLVPRHVLFGNPERTSPEISPDGTRMGFLAAVEGVLNVWVGPLDGSAEPRPVTADRHRGIPVFGFCQDDRSLVYLQDGDGDENWRVHLLDLVDGTSTCLTPPGTRARIAGHNRWNRDRLLIELNQRDPRLADLYRYDLRSGTLEAVETNPGFASWIVDTDLVVRGGTSVRPDGSAVIHLRDPSTGEFRPWYEISPDDAASTDVLGLTRDGRRLLLLTPAGGGAGRLVALDVPSGERHVLAEDPHADIARVELHPETLEPQAVVFLRDREDWLFLDPAFERQVANIRASLAALEVDGEVAIGRSTRADGPWLVSVTPSDGGPRYYLYDPDTAELAFLFIQSPALDRYRLARMEPFGFTSRDGLHIRGYVTFPPGVPRSNLPAVVNVHGGPWSRDIWGYDPHVQWLANRGYVCIQVNFRGSKGFGRAFSSAGDKEWGRRMLDDLLDAVNFCVREGWVDRNRVGIMGASYGGYAALAAAAFAPTVFRCAIDLFGPSDLITMLESIPPHWKPMAAFMYEKVGDPRTERDMLWERSPLSAVERIRIPVLVVQGKNDPRVKQTESERIVAALAAKGIPHEYLLFEDEGHGLARPENRERFYRTAECFLAEHLGGRCEEHAVHRFAEFRSNRFAPL